MKKQAWRAGAISALSIGGAAVIAFGGVNAFAASSAPVINLTQWTYYAPAQLAATQFEKLHPNIHIHVEVFPGSSYETKLQEALSTGTNPPDIFDLDMGYIGQFINTSYVANLSQMGAGKLVAGMVPYVAAGGEMANGAVGAITDTSSPGGFWYNRVAAKKWLGTDVAGRVSAMVDTWAKINNLSRKVAQESGGKVHLLDFPGDVMAVEQYHTGNWVQNGKLVINPAWNGALNEMRILNQPGMTAQMPTFGAAWGTALNDHSGNAPAILFAVPSWAGFMLNTKTANGQYGVASAPTGYYEGGRYGAIYSGSPNKKAAYEFLQYLASPQWQTWDLNHTANMPSLQSVYRKYMNTYTFPWFGKEHLLEMYYKISMNIPPQRQDSYYQNITSDMGGISATMLAEHKSNAWAFQQLKAQVKSSYPNITVN